MRLTSRSTLMLAAALCVAPSLAAATATPSTRLQAEPAAIALKSRAVHGRRVGTAGWLLFDTGVDTGDARACWQRLLAGPLSGGLSRIMVSHHHPDHLGLARWLPVRWWQSPRLRAFADQLAALMREPVSMVVGDLTMTVAIGASSAVSLRSSISRAR